MNTHEWPRCIKTARRKRRLVKTHRDKQLIQLYKRRKELWEQRALLPMVPLEYPYQRGWKRFFVLRDDLKHSPRAEFYTTLLSKINTVQHDRDKAFKRKKRRRSRYGYVQTKQALKEFLAYCWNNNKIGLTEQEMACFTLVETFDIKTRRANMKYVFNEPWRYVLKVEPNMVTHTKLLDVDIERELSQTKNHVDNHYLTPRIDKLKYGCRYRWHSWYYEPAKYINKFKNIPRYSPKEVYLELET
ncbi:hypothetical protein BDD43_3251 [Mucilaginibacter gracilis]|uniref:Uncharacterized protein n=1 Tax=Mucilaginibacter gracilis TaxID=423350 RepID=A0A495J2Z8_9SPHI|nr:hypothetical protein [Mucilaginibacter gracilis]RKR83051.1 hypothetical protein BDD43_3251 [Mucilaginibacter gracilis]